MTDTFQIHNGILTFPALSAHSNIIHGVTTRNFHDDPFDKAAILQKIIEVLILKPRLIATCKQIHEANVATITSADIIRRDNLNVAQNVAQTPASVSVGARLVQSPPGKTTRPQNEDVAQTPSSVLQLSNPDVAQTPSSVSVGMRTSRPRNEDVAQTPSSVQFIEFDNTDALVTSEPGVLLAVVSADCVPILLADPIGGQIGVVHAGWRGTYARIARNAMRAMQAAGAKPFRTVAHTGPCISQQNYEVSPELIEQFRARFPDCAAAFDGRRLDLELLNLHQLRQAGLKLDNVHLASQCTFAHSELFPSYRRDGQNAGRLYSFILIPVA